MSTLSNAFSKNANIGYVVAGYPSMEHTKSLLLNLDNSSLDILEIGIPYSDPIADGAKIQEAGLKAIQNGVNTDDVFELLYSVDVKKPLVFLVYYNLILAYGINLFVQKAKRAKIQGFIVPDLPFEENKDLFLALKEAGIALIPLISASSTTRIKKILSRAAGFVYCVAVVGITGGKKLPLKDLQNLVANVKSQTKLPVAIGFGVKTKEDVQELRGVADGVIVGTKLVEFCESSNTLELIDDLFATP